MKINRTTDISSITESRNSNEPRPVEKKETKKTDEHALNASPSDVNILNELMRSDEYLLLKKLHKQRKDFASAAADKFQEMPRADQLGAIDHTINGQQKLKTNMNLADWELLRIFHNNAILLDEIKKLDSRRSQLTKIEKDANDMAVLRDDFFMQAKILGQIKDRALLNHIHATKRLDEKIQFSRLEKKLDKKAFIQKRAEFEHFLHLIGFKLGYLPLPRMQRHIVEDGHDDRVRFTHAKLENIRNRDFETSKARLEFLLAAGQLAYKIANRNRNVAYFKAEDNVLALNTQIQSHIILQYELYMRSKGYTPGWLPLPAKARELAKKREIPPEVEHQRKLAKMDDKALVNHWLESQQQLKSKSDIQQRLKAIMQRGENHDEQILTRLQENSERLWLKLFDDARAQVESFFATNFATKKQDKIQNEDTYKKEQGALLRDADQDLKHDIRELESYMRSIGYKPEGIPIPGKQREIEIEKKSEEKQRGNTEQLKITDLTETRQKMAQLRAASELAKQEATHNERLQDAKEKDQFAPDLTQRIKAAK